MVEGVVLNGFKRWWRALSSAVGCYRISRDSKGFYCVLRHCFEVARGGGEGCERACLYDVLWARLSAKVFTAVPNNLWGEAKKKNLQSLTWLRHNNHAITSNSVHFQTVSSQRYSWCCVHLYIVIVGTKKKLCDKWNKEGQLLRDVGVLMSKGCKMSDRNVERWWWRGF